MKNEYTELDSLQRGIFLTRIINCLCCSDVGYQAFLSTIVEQEAYCKEKGHKLATINLQLNEQT